MDEGLPGFIGFLMNADVDQESSTMRWIGGRIYKVVG